ncbi:DUF7302 family protein [Streptomyces thermoviolaceus]|uniref:DUF7302 family protein n=1 Tax=Streptomyces thermoviolaceus TaxID=1952 RepID=UPI0016753284|nr:hypothetical protein [Streptomyces thermoviolaceus]GGV80477.1 hypothetical protein GCM10010499_43500 [Streptomyces thermoviolaceus subsp. apingens]
MRIRITAVTSVSDGAGHRYRSGQVADVTDDLAAAWIAAGHAEQADEEQTPPASPKQAAKRTATRRAPRKATRKDT